MWQVRRGRILTLVKKEFIQIRRDRRMLPILLILPVLQLIILGYAVSSDIKHLATVVCDLDRSPASRGFADRLATSGYFDIRYRLTDERQIKGLMDAGRVRVGIVIPPRFAARLSREERATIQLLLDGTDSNTANVAQGYVTQIANAEAKRILVDRLGPKASPPLAVDASIRVWFNPDLKSVNFMVPGVVALILTIVTMTMTATAIVKEKERGTIEQLIVSPIRPYELMLGKAIPFVLIGYADILIVVLVGVLWFRVPIAGSFPLLLVLSGLFILTTLGLGLLLSTVSQTQQQAMMLGFFINPPFMLLSGFIFPIASMPQPMQYLTYLISLRYFLVIIRGIFLKGVGLDVLWPQALALLIFGLSVLTLSVLRFQKHLG
ncbi:MAG TPA: ABC transporter permease [Candidatus Methylomirabilis sp.]|nr:ABC transporter permease [Candidatus Methylomirabilis sp.]